MNKHKGQKLAACIIMVVIGAVSILVFGLGMRQSWAITSGQVWLAAAVLLGWLG